MLRSFSILLLLFTLSNVSVGQCYQKASGSNKLAKEYFEYDMYNCALGEYLLIHTKKPKNTGVNRRIAQCYLRLPGNKALAIKYLEFLSSLEKYDNQVLFELGQAFHFKREYKKAIDSFTKYKTNASEKEKEIADKYIDFCNNATELEKHPIDITFNNLGKEINSKFADSHPFSPGNEEFIAFTTKREGTTGGQPDFDGFTADVYFAKVKKNKYSKARSIGGMFNTEFSEEVAGGSPNGKNLIYCHNDFTISNLRISKKVGRARSFPTPTELVGINSKSSNEIAATLTNDGALIIFSSDRKGGFGGFDLWMSRVLPTGVWGTPINLGPKINTKYDEVYPMFSQDGKTIYFSSQGHINMGGFDLFETTFSDELKTWTSPKNLGYPLNTPSDDINIVYTDGGRNAYISAFRADSYGMSDIYRVTFNDVLPKYTVVKVKIEGDSSKVPSLIDKAQKEIDVYTAKRDSLYALSNDTLKEKIANYDSILTLKKAHFELINPYSNNKIVVTNSQNGSIYGEYLSNPRNGQCVLILEPGKYIVKISNDGYESQSFPLKIYDKVFYTPQMSKNLVIQPKADI